MSSNGKSAPNQLQIEDKAVMITDPNNALQILNSYFQDGWIFYTALHWGQVKVVILRRY